MDVDIDFMDRNAAAAVLRCVPAMTLRDDVPTRHPSGVYVQDIPVNPLTGMSSLTHKEAEQLGYTKIDLLNNRIYDGIMDEAHLIEMMDREPDWELLGLREIVETLPHVHSHFGLVQRVCPRSVEDLAVVLALMRPGKRRLIGKSREEIDAEIWTREDNQYTFKKAHAIAYAVSIVVRMNVMVDEMATELEAGEYITF